MKTKLYKIMAVAVTVTMLVSLMIGSFAAPASAQPPPKPLKWGGVGPPPPGADGGWFWNGDILDLGPMVKAIDGTIWLAVELGGPDAGYYLFKSTDFGRKWDDVDYEGGAIKVIECSSTDADILYVADCDNEVYRTTNGGDRFTPIGNPTDLGDSDITALSVGYKRNGDAVIYASTANSGSTYGDVYYLDEEATSPGWTATDIVGNRAVAPGGDDPQKMAWYYADVWDVQVSPDYATDRFVVAVATAYVDDADGETYYTGTFCTYQYAGGQWAGTTADAELTFNPREDPDVSGDEYDFAVYRVYDASIWLPDGFDSDPEGDMEFFVGITSYDPPGYEGDVYQVINSGSWDLDLAGTDTATNVVDLAGTGDAGDAMMVALGNDGDPSNAFTGYVVYRTDDAGEKWDEQEEQPTGTIPGRGSVVVADDFADSEECLFATKGDDCAVSLSRDMGETCDQISMISTNDKGGSLSYALGASYYLLMASDTDVYSLYRQDNDKNWERVAMPPNDSCQVYVSPDGDAIFYLDADNATVYASTDGGTYFKEWRGQPPEAYCMLPISKSEAFVGGAGAVYHTTRSGTTWKTYDEGLTGPLDGNVTQLVMSPDYDADETLLALVDGKIAKSSDGGQEWSEVKGFGPRGSTATCAAFHPDYADNGAIFGGGSDPAGDLLVYRLGNPDIEDDLEADDEYGPATGIGLGSDGTLYVGAEDADGMLRMLMPMSDDADDFEWQLIAEGLKDPDYLSQSLTVVGGSNVIYSLAHVPADGPNPEKQQLQRYEDTLTGKVALSAPSDGSSTDKVDRVSLSWKAMDGADRYQVEFDRDPEFNGAPRMFESEPTSFDVLGLDDGETYYWRVRVLENRYEEMFSNWSDTWSFTTKLGAGQWNPFVGGVPEAPANGATNVPLDPTFAWNAADWATSYEFILAKDAAFTDVVVSKTGANALNTTVYMSEQSLEYSTTYYWKVRGKSNTSASEWATAVFTTIGAPGAPPTAPPTATPTPEPTTPVYIWVIIGVGAALVIAVIVLIVRTRRVA